ncbi:MAG: NYN domain-containing protein [Candidatus Eisenbacteria bacterium]|nr:NYN domain-containing protein [Candidatus Eisenbacteria bacterium]
MPEHLIVVDGYNLILRTATLKPSGTRTLRESRDKLVNLLSWGFGGGDARFLVVFDGSEGPGKDESSTRVEVRFSRPPLKADDLIREIVEHQMDRVDRLTVVTSDLEVARHARAMGADIALADLFLTSALGAGTESEIPEKPATISKRELEEWANLFKSRQGKDALDD